MRRDARLVLGPLLVLAMCLLAAAGGRASAASAPSAAALESSLLAPCCFGGTLDVHDSEVARELRREIERRVRRGEPTDAIEADLVARYGPRIRAMPHPDAYSGAIAAAALLAGLGAVGLALLVRRWRRGGLEAPRSATSAIDAYDERLDADLEELE